jgi:hypothetical protein
MTERLARRLFAPVDPAGLVAFRVAFGLLVFASATRFVAKGWVEPLLVAPTFQFKYWGFEWVRLGPAWSVYALFGLVALLGLAVAVGLFYRAAAALLFFGFTYLELADTSYYLNHYYLLSLLALLAAVTPLGRVLSIDAWRGRALPSLPAWCLYLLRFQIGLVYFFAGVAKAGPDWLLHGQPLGIWLAARGDLPVVGPLFALPETALVMSWAGFLFDTTIPFWLSWRRTRLGAYLVLVVFHALVGVLFPIGMFPFIMVAAATVFFDPGWPRALARRVGLLRLAPAPPPSDRAAIGWTGTRRLAVALFALHALAQLGMPLRFLAYPGDVLWHEQGMRWSWRVMVREKNGAVTYRVRAVATGREIFVSPRRYLTRHQEREMSGQPDLILQLAHHVARDLEARFGGPVEVRADTLVSLNGRAPRPLVDPTVDLTTVRDGLARAEWILGVPGEPPPRRWAPAALAAGR